MSASSQKRNRACEGCHRLKIKCDVSPTPGKSCERCTRNDIECVPTAPRLQRDRIQELETQVEELRNALRLKTSTDTKTDSNRGPEDRDAEILSFLDARIPPSKQQYLLALYYHQAGAAWPVIRIPTELERFRAQSPILLLCVLVYCFPQQLQGTPNETHDELVRYSMRLLGDEVIGRGQKSLNLAQALLVAAFWNKTTRGGMQGSCYQLIQLAADMSIDLGIAGTSLQPSPEAYFCRHGDVTSLEAHRMWLACFVALSAASLHMRRSNPYPWSTHHQESLIHLERAGNQLDVFLCQILRIVQLIENISIQLGLCEVPTFVDASHHRTLELFSTTRDQVDAWAEQVPHSLASSQALRVLHHVAMIHVHEVVLHTPTNKASFAAPFIPGRLPVNDFPKPAHLSPLLQSALIDLVYHCHAAIDTAAEIDAALVLSLPSFCFAPSILYALFVLVTAYVAATDPANTYGQCLSADSFRIEECGAKLRRLTENLKHLDPTMSCWNTRMIDATNWLEEWYNDYTTIVRQFGSKIAM